MNTQADILRTYDYLLYELDDGLLTVTLNRPKVLNALNEPLLHELEDALSRAWRDDAVKAVILTGAGDKAFVAGADIAAMADMDPLKARDYAELGHRVMSMLEQMPKPTIAAVNGYALGGGCELAMATDMIFASNRARFGQPESKLGLIPGFGGCVRLPRLVGRWRAKYMIFTGEIFDAQEAERLGLVVKVFPHEDLITEVTRVARTILARSASAVEIAKGVIDKGYDGSLQNAVALEKSAFALTFATPDAREGMAAFLGKREPTFEGRRR
jgi:enoyl-CoA hydratase